MELTSNIPEGWQELSLFDLADRQKARFDDGDWVEAQHITNEGVRLIQTGNIGVGSYIEKDTKKYVYEASFVSLKCKPLEVGDLLICRLAEPAGRACILPDIGDARVITSVDVSIFRPDQQRFDRGYLVQYLSTPEWFESVVENVGGTTHKRISRSALGKIKVPIPIDKSEQSAIATALSEVDALLAAQDALIAKKRAIKQGAMQELLTGKRRLPGFSGDWELRRLDQLAGIRSGGTPSTSRSEFWDGDVLWVTPTDITALDGHKHLSDTARKISELGLKSSSAEIVPANSIVMTSRATIGECAINSVPLSTNQGFENFVPKKSVDVEFLYYLLTTQKQGFISLCAGALLDRPLAQLFDKAHLLDFLYHFVIFDGGIKKVPRQHQHAGIKAAQERTRKREGGVIWHTQGSGKSILMVLLAKWLLEDDPNARILVITDRDELDDQITKVLKNAGLDSTRVTSRADLVDKLGATTPRLLCALIHKFDTTDLTGLPPPAHGRFYVFVDEAHRTQGGDMNKQMKRWLGDAIFIGFTGTPLLRKDKQTTHEVFGTYIHTYKFPQAVADKVVLDLKYEAREVPQQLGNKDRIEAYFAEKTKRLNNFQKAALRKRWATMEELLSSKERKDRIINSILEDFDTRRRLSDGRGTAILVADEIYDACHYFRLFQNTDFGKHVGIITSFEPDKSQYSKEPAGSDYRYKYETYKDWVLKAFDSTDKYEAEMKRRFKDEPANCKLLIVVSKLLTGFDAPSCTYIYLDRNLRDHDLFQAICRTNRLDGDDKDYGYIVDFKELFGKVQEAISVYSSDDLEVDAKDGQDGNVTLKNWIAEGAKKLEESREALLHLCEPVLAPRELEQFIAYFCGESQDADALEQAEPLRISFYKLVTAFVRAWADIGSELPNAGYDEATIARLEKEVAFYSDMRAAIKNYSGEEFDIKPFEGDMRDLLNRYVRADDARALGDMGDLSLVDLIVKTGIHDAIAQKLNANGASNKAVAEGIINNVRKAIIQERLTDPRFFKEMSSLLDELIKQSRADAKSYEKFLKQAEDLARKLAAHASGGEQAPEALQGKPAAVVIYRNLPDILAKTPDAAHVGEDPNPHASELIGKAVQIDTTMRESVPAGWKGDGIKERLVRRTLLPLVDGDREAMLRLFELVKNQPGYS